ncbi:hypothetical protein IVB27_35450 [Bradyrhizobium sp. 197]|uniref:hypothetical protein n=1 Tax=Bradyrhizobium sp. 197 TaxID=2782663 RepID=UPI001FFBFD42|nr:hypothetical protein [Bradyrhizobium sp. 197]MCK1479898.1 hypothetical protein [Bradyrhizobium sp. 197]
MADNKIHKTGGLLDQYNLLGAIIDSHWATRLDHKVARHVIDRYYPKHGNGRASLRYLERATGSSRSNITTSLRRLAENGAIIITRQGQGTRPTEYALNFDLSASVPVDVTSTDDVPSGTVDVTSSGHADNTTSNSSVPVDVTESYLLNPAYKAEIQIDRVDPTAPTAPPLADGLAATAAGGTAVEERAPAKPTFELCYRTYAFLKGKKEAKAAWDALPAEVDRTAVIKAAAAWQASWEAQGKPDAPRYALARWLKDERYDEDAPKGYEPRERTAKPAKASPTTSTTAKPAKPAVRTTVRLTSADVVKAGSTTELRITATDSDGFKHERILLLEDDDAESQFEGQRQFARLVHAAGLEQIEDGAELLGRTVILTGNNDAFAAPTTRPDDEPPLPTKPEPVRYAKPSAAPPVSRARELTPAEEAERADYDAWYEASLRDDAA